MMRERIIWKNCSPQKDSGHKEKEREKKKNEEKNEEKNQKLNSMNRTQKTPDYSRCFLGFGTFYKVDGLNNYANLPTYGLRTNQGCQFSI